MGWHGRRARDDEWDAEGRRRRAVRAYRRNPFGPARLGFCARLRRSFYEFSEEVSPCATGRIRPPVQRRMPFLGGPTCSSLSRVRACALRSDVISCGGEAFALGADGQARDTVFGMMPSVARKVFRCGDAARRVARDCSDRCRCICKRHVPLSLSPSYCRMTSAFATCLGTATTANSVRRLHNLDHIETHAFLTAYEAQIARMFCGASSGMNCNVFDEL
jgi:hypothetical protein